MQALWKVSTCSHRPSRGFLGPRLRTISSPSLRGIVALHYLSRQMDTGGPEARSHDRHLFDVSGGAGLLAGVLRPGCWHGLAGGSDFAVVDKLNNLPGSNLVPLIVGLIGSCNRYLIWRYERLCDQSCARFGPAPVCRCRGIHQQRAVAYDLFIGKALIQAHAVKESERPAGEDTTQFKGKRS